jgi:type I restriction enzyme M protein
MEGAHTVVLGEVVTSARPMPVTKDQSATAVGEIGAADIPAHGYISKPGRTVQIEDTPKNRQNFLRPLDLVLIVKGSVGKVGIVSPDVPPPGPDGWVAGQSAIILRVTDDLMDPRALALQLRSPFGQQLLKQIVSGATIPLIQIRELMRLSVLLPDRDSSAAAGAALEKEDRLQQQIGELQKKLTEVTADLWPVG